MKKVLIVDDVKGWRDYNSNIVKELFEEVEIETADSAQEAYDILLQEKPFDIIITDLQMEDTFEPKFAGEWLVEQIKTLSSYKNSRIIISSGTFNIKNIAEGLNVDYIPKRVACGDIQKYEDVILGR